MAGSAVTEYLVSMGYEVLCADIVHPNRPVCPYKVVDLTDLGQVYGILAATDHVVHFGGIPRPTLNTPDAVFRTNVMATFNVFEAVVNLGIRRVVYASSKSVIGYPFQHQSFSPRYAPIDEEHPEGPQDAYALSKYIGEEIAKGFVRRMAGRLSVASLRLSWIHTPATFKDQITPLQSFPAQAMSNLWTYVDSRDVAEATRLALEVDFDGHEAIFVAASDSFSLEPTADLVRKFYPDTQIRSGLEGSNSILSISKARRVLGFTPKHLWSSYL